MSIPDKAMKLKDGKIIADKLSSMVAVQFATDVANEAETYVVYNGSVYYLPNGHTAGTSWANTEKEGPTNIGEELNTVKSAIHRLESKTFDIEYDPGELFNGVYGRQDGYKKTGDQYKYGLSNDVSIKNMERFGSVTVECQGAYVNVFRRNKNGVGAGFDCTDYQQNMATVTLTTDLSYVNFSVRLNPNDETALTEEQIAELTAKIKVICKKTVAENDSTRELCGDDVELINGVYSQTTGQLITNHIWGDSLATPIEIGKTGKATIICPKYKIRTFLFPSDTKEGFTAGSEYQQGMVQVEGTSNLTRFAFIVCKENDDAYALTAEQLAEIKKNLKIVYTFVKSGRNAVTENLISKAAYSSSVIGSPRLYLSEVPQESGILNSVSSDVYDRYDAMCVAYPKWIKRMPDIGEDADGNKIRHYIVRMFDPIVGYQAAYTNESEEKVNYWESKFKYRRAFINTGTHGNEKASVWALVYWLEELLDSNEEWARFIKANYMLDIVPILDPWGFDNNSRNNKNDVNINRDYLKPDNEKQPETLSLTNYISSIKDDIFCALDLHTTTGLMGYFCAHESNPLLGTIMRIVNQVIASCVDDWESVANDLGSDSTHYPYSYGCLGMNDGTLEHYMVDQCITNLSCTVETFKVDSDADLVKSTKIIRDEFANLLMGFLAISEAPIEKQNSAIPCTSISLSDDTITLDSMSDTETLIATVTPANTTDEVTWESSNEDVVTVINGVVSVVGIGTATITAKCGYQTATANVTVEIECTPNWDWFVANFNTERGIATYTVATGSYAGKYMTAFGIGDQRTNTEIPENSQSTTSSPYCIKLPQGTKSIRVSATAQSSKFYNGTGSRVIWTQDVSPAGETNKIKGIQRDEFNSSQMPVVINVPEGADSFALTMRYNEAQTAASANALAEADGLKIEFLQTVVTV